MTFQIFLKHNRTHTMMVTNETTIKDIQKYILDRLKVPSQHYYLSSGNKVLDERFKLEDYSIHAETTIHIVIRSAPNSVKIKN